MEEQIKQKILWLSDRLVGRMNAMDVREAALIVGLSEREFRECVKELFEEGYNVICVPKVRGCPHGFCMATEEDMLLAEVVLRKHCISGLIRVRKLEQRRISLSRPGQLNLLYQ